MSLSRFWWGLRAHWWLVGVGVLLGAALALGPLRRETPPGERYEASALVLAQQLAIRPEQLPRLVEAVFHAGSVADRASATLDRELTGEELVPRYVDVEPIVDTIAARVTGRGPDGLAAAARANAAAEALVAELNQSGPGVGVFLLQDPARPPDAPRPQEGSGLVFVAFSAGLLALGLLVLALVVRQPVVDADDAAAVTGTPVLGAVRLRRRAEPTRSVVGISALAGRLLPSPDVTVGLLGVRRTGRLVDRLARHLCEATKDRFPCDVADLGSGDVKDLEVTPGAAVVLHGAVRDDLDIAQVLGAVPVALVVVEGTPRQRVVDAVGQLAGTEILGVAFVSRHRWSGAGGGASARASVDPPTAANISAVRARHARRPG